MKITSCSFLQHQCRADYCHAHDCIGLLLAGFVFYALGASSDPEGLTLTKKIVLGGLMCCMLSLLPLMGIFIWYIVLKIRIEKFIPSVGELRSSVGQNVCARQTTIRHGARRHPQYQIYSQTHPHIFIESGHRSCDLGAHRNPQLVEEIAQDISAFMQCYMQIRPILSMPCAIAAMALSCLVYLLS